MTHADEAKRIAIVGGGVAGLSALWLLNEHSPHHVEIYEAEARLGGHANSVLFQQPGKQAAWVDTAFVMFNSTGWPNFFRFLLGAGVPVQRSSGSYSVSHPSFAWGSSSPWTLFTGRLGIFDWRPWRMVLDVIRWNYRALDVIRQPRGVQCHPRVCMDETVGVWLERNGFSDVFRDSYLIPLAATIWSIPPKHIIENISIRTIAEGFHATDMLKLFNRAPWYIVQGGSREYIKRIAGPVDPGCIHLGAPVQAVRDRHDAVELVLPDGSVQAYDHVILATHSDTAYRLLQQGQSLRQGDEEILTTCSWEDLEVVMHYDEAVMPGNRNVWSAWNSFVGGESQGGPSSTTFDMNLLHGLPVDDYGRMFGSINPPSPPDPDKVVCTVRYASPILVGGPRNVAGRLRSRPSARTRRIRFAGAWTGLGTHEDGWVSGTTAAEELGAVMPWAKVDRTPRVPERDYVELLCAMLLEITVGRFWGRLLQAWFIAT